MSMDDFLFHVHEQEPVARNSFSTNTALADSETNQEGGIG